MHAVRVRHVSPHGPDYTRVHVIVPHAGVSLSQCVSACGAVPPMGAMASVICSGRHPDVPEIVYPGGVRPVALDPAGVVVQMVGCSVYVDVPYKCSFEQLQRTVIPAKLRHMGVHAFAVRGALARQDGRVACAGDVWGDNVASLWWTKLRVRVKHRLAPRTTRGLVCLQRRARARGLVQQYELV